MKQEEASGQHTGSQARGVPREEAMVTQLGVPLEEGSNLRGTVRADGDGCVSDPQTLWKIRQGMGASRCSSGKALVILPDSAQVGPLRVGDLRLLGAQKWQASRHGPRVPEHHAGLCGAAVSGGPKQPAWASGSLKSSPAWRGPSGAWT